MTGMITPRLHIPTLDAPIDEYYDRPELRYRLDISEAVSEMCGAIRLADMQSSRIPRQFAQIVDSARHTKDTYITGMAVREVLGEFGVLEAYYGAEAQDMFFAGEYRGWNFEFSSPSQVAVFGLAYFVPTAKSAAREQFSYTARP